MSSDTVRADFVPMELCFNQMLIMGSESIHAETNRCSPDESTQLPARYHVLILLDEKL